MMKPEKIRNLHPPKEKETEEKPVKAEEEKQNKAVEKAKEFLRDNPLKTIVLYFAMMGMLGENLPKNAAMEKQQDRMSQLGEDMVDDSIDMWNEAMNNFPKKEPAKLTPEEKKQVEERAKALAGVLDTFAYMPGMEEASEMTQTDLAAIGAPAIPHLINILDGLSEKEAGSLLVWMGEESEPLLINALSDENESILKKEAVIRVLVKMEGVSQDTIKVLTKLIRPGGDEDLQFAAAEALVSLGAKENASEILPLAQFRIRNAVEDPINAKKALKMLVLLGERELFTQGLTDINETSKYNKGPSYDTNNILSLIINGEDDTEGFISDLFKFDNVPHFNAVENVSRVLYDVYALAHKTSKENQSKLSDLAPSLLRSKDDNVKLSSLMILEGLEAAEFAEVFEGLSEKEVHELFALVQTIITEDMSIWIGIKKGLLRVLSKSKLNNDEAGLVLDKIFKKVMASGSDELFSLFNEFAELKVAKINDALSVVNNHKSSEEKKSYALRALVHFDISKNEEAIKTLRSIYEDRPKDNLVRSGENPSSIACWMLIKANKMEQEELKKIVTDNLADGRMVFDIFVQMVKKGDEGVRFFQSIKSEMLYADKKILKSLGGGVMYKKVFGKKG